MSQEFDMINQKRVNDLVDPFTWTASQKTTVRNLVYKESITAADLNTAWTRIADRIRDAFGVDLIKLEADRAAADQEEQARKQAHKKPRTGYYNQRTLDKFLDAYNRALEAVKNGQETRVRISHDNSKMGPVASVSLLPFYTCPGVCAHTCGRDCYAAKLANLRPAVLWSYAVNTAILVVNPASFWEQVNAAIAAVRYFRFHVAGDIRNSEYFRDIVQTAADHPHTEILMFTKHFHVVNNYVETHGGNRAAAIPENLHVMFSAWAGLDPVNPYHFPETVVYTTESEISDSWKMCGGNCFECACRGVGCWQAVDGDTIAFKKH